MLNTTMDGTGGRAESGWPCEGLSTTPVILFSVQRLLASDLSVMSEIDTSLLFPNSSSLLMTERDTHSDMLRMLMCYHTTTFVTPLPLVPCIS